MWMLNAWQVAAFASEVGEKLLSRRLCDRPVMLYRRNDGLPVAMEDQCPHRLVPLSAGVRIGDRVQCIYHGMQFGPDGVCAVVPGQDLVPAAARVQVYPVVERYNIIWIWLGESSLADPALVPDCHWMACPGWAASTGYHHMDANFRLLTDNLLDLSHETYIHEGTVGNAPAESVANFAVHTTQERSRLVRAHREMPSIAPPPLFQLMVGDVARINRWQSAVYMPPGSHMTNAGGHLVGTPRESASMLRVLHLLTPESETSTHYFWAACRNFSVSEDGVTERVREAVRVTFDEDKHVLELQQRAILATPGRNVPNVAIRVDAAPIQARRMLAGFIDREQQDPRFVAPPIPMASDGVIPFAEAVAA